MHGERPPDIRLDLVGDDYEAVAGVLVEHPVDLDRVAPGDDVAVVVGVADLGAVERAGALGTAFGVVEHRLGAKLERMRLLCPFGRSEGPVTGRHLGLGRVEHAEQRRPGGAIDAECAELSGARVEAQCVLAGIADDKLVIVVVAGELPEADCERVVAARIGRAVPREIGVDEAPVVPVVGCGVGDDGGRAVVPGARPSRLRDGASRFA